MGYITDLRKKIGHQTIIMPCACVLIVDENKGVLLQHRVDNGLWSYHGGSIEIDEKVEDAAKREVFEETNLVLDKLRFFNIYSGPSMHYTYPNKDDVSPIDIVYICEAYHGDIILQEEEVSELRWFSKEEIQTLAMTPQNRRVILDYFASIENF